MKKILIAAALFSLAASAFALPNLLEKKEVAASSIKNLDFKLSWEELRIQETFGSSIDIEIYTNNKKVAPSVNASGSTLCIESNKRSFTYFPGSRCIVIVYVPKNKQFNDVDLSMSSGDINVETELYAMNIRMSASSGDINSVKGLFADEINLKASSGDITATNMDADDFKAETSSGDINLREFTGLTGYLKATSGELEVEGFAAEYVSFKTTSGEISVKKIDCDYFDAVSTSGEICLEFEKEPIAKSSAKAASGKINLVIPKNASFEIDAHSNSGTYKNEFTNNKFVPRDTYHESINGGGAVIELTTSSGDIEVEY